MRGTVHYSVLGEVFGAAVRDRERRERRDRRRRFSGVAVGLLSSLAAGGDLGVAGVSPFGGVALRLPWERRRLCPCPDPSELGCEVAGAGSCDSEAVAGRAVAESRIVTGSSV